MAFTLMFQLFSFEDEIVEYAKNNLSVFSVDNVEFVLFPG